MCLTQLELLFHNMYLIRSTTMCSVGMKRLSVESGHSRNGVYVLRYMSVITMKHSETGFAIVLNSLH